MSMERKQLSLTDFNTSNISIFIDRRKKQFCEKKTGTKRPKKINKEIMFWDPG